MTHFQLLRNGFPDQSFFGNTFVALALAANIPDSILVAKKKRGFDDPETWKSLVKKNHGVDLEYSRHWIKGDTSLIDIVRPTLRSGRAVVNYHFADSELTEDIMTRLPKEFGDNVKQYMHLHCSSDFFFRDKDRRQQRKDGIERALGEGWVKKFIAVSYRVRDSYLEFIPKEMIEVVPNGIPEHIYKFRPEPDRDAFKQQFGINGKYIIGYCGRLDFIKGYEDLLNIMHWFNGSPLLSDVGFVIGTSGGQRTKKLMRDLDRKAPRLLAEDRVGIVLDVAKLAGDQKDLNAFAYDQFKALVDNRPIGELPIYKGITPVPLQALCDVYIQPSVSEGLPLSVIEAVFTGTPVVAHDVGGLREIISGANGRLIDPLLGTRKKVEQFGNAILDSLTENYGPSGELDTTAYRNDLRERLLKDYGAKAMADRTQQVYKNTAGSK